MSHHIEYQRFRRGEGCAEEGCRSQKFYIEDGKKFCKRGHEQAGFTQTEQDEDDWNKQGKKSRRQREEKERIATVLSGHDAKELYLQCYQLILWKQCHWLVNVKGFPKELETIVRDLWGLRVSLVHKREHTSGYGSGTGNTAMFSSMSEGESADTAGTKAKSFGSGRRRHSAANEERLPKLVETLALCYLALMLLRLPTSLGEVYRWASREEIVYNRAMAEVPKEMSIKLPGQFHRALEMKSVLKGSSLYKAVQGLVEFYAFHFEMVCPPINAPLILFKHIKDLCLPIEIYPAVGRLAKLLDIEFSWPSTFKKSSTLPAYPELQMISLIVIAVKLSHPFDDIDRTPETDADPTVLKIDWPKWKRTMEERPSRGFERGEEIKVADNDVWSLSAKKIDDYLDWYQRTWVDDRDPKIAEQLLELFPLGELGARPLEEQDHPEKESCLKQIQNELLVQRSKPFHGDGSKVNRPGELYKRNRAVEKLPAMAKAFCEVAASNAGIPLDMLVRGVFQQELKLDNWNMTERRKEKARSVSKELMEGDMEFNDSHS